MNIHTSLVPFEHVATIWGSISPLMDMAARSTHGRYEVEDIVSALEHDNHHLWIVFNEADIIGMFITVLKQYPRKRYLELAFIAGKDTILWKEQSMDILRRWAYDNKCAGIEGCARFGWAKIFKEDGYQPLWQVFEMPVGDAGLGEYDG